MSQIVEALRRELAELQAELRSDPRFVKIQRIEDLLAVYEGDKPSANPPIVAQDAAQAPPPPTPPRQTGAKPQSKANEIRAAIAALLTEQQSQHRKVILDHLIAKGLMGHEKNPMAQLAAYLSDWRAEFKSDGQGNFSLAQGANAATSAVRESRTSGLPFDQGGFH